MRGVPRREILPLAANAKADPKRKDAMTGSGTARDTNPAARIPPCGEAPVSLSRWDGTDVWMATGLVQP